MAAISPIKFILFITEIRTIFRENTCSDMLNYVRYKFHKCNEVWSGVSDSINQTYDYNNHSDYLGWKILVSVLAESLQEASLNFDKIDEPKNRVFLSVIVTMS